MRELWLSVLLSSLDAVYSFRPACGYVLELVSSNVLGANVLWACSVYSCCVCAPAVTHIVQVDSPAPLLLVLRCPIWAFAFVAASCRV